MRYDRLRDFFSFVPFFLFLSMAAAACSPSFSFLLPFLQRSLCLSSAGLMKFDGDRACNYRLSRADACLALNSLTGEFVIIRKRGGWFNLFSPKFFFSFPFSFFVSLSPCTPFHLNHWILQYAWERIRGRDFFCSSFKSLWIRDRHVLAFFRELTKEFGKIG